MDKRRFLGVIVAALLMLLIPVLGGCGGSKDDWGREDSQYLGSYGGGAWMVSGGRSQDSGNLNFTVNTKGDAVGEVYQTDSIGRVSIVGALRGKFDNNGQFHGEITRDGETIPFWGYFARQGIPVTDNTVDPPVTTDKTGLAGDFRQRVGDTEFTGTFYAIGGNIISGGGGGETEE
jgi:hypothetical protein